MTGSSFRGGGGSEVGVVGSGKKGEEQVKKEEEGMFEDSERCIRMR